MNQQSQCLSEENSLRDNPEATSPGKSYSPNKSSDRFEYADSFAHSSAHSQIDEASMRTVSEHPEEDDHEQLHALQNAPGIPNYQTQADDYTTSIVRQSPQESDQQKVYYKELTDKLEAVLSKISSKTKMKGKHSTNEIYKRFQECEEFKKREIELKRYELQKRELRDLRAKPIINPNSIRMVKELGHEPIYERYEKIAQEKRDKLKENERICAEKQREAEQIFMEEFKKQFIPPEKMRTYDDYFQDMLLWTQKTKKAVADKAEAQIEKEKEVSTFAPVLNKRSLKMINKKGRVPIQERPIVRKIVEAEFSFTPQTNKRRK